MKKLLLFTLLFSSSAFALQVTELTGSFADAQVTRAIDFDTSSAMNFGTFSPLLDEDRLRAQPAMPVAKDELHVTELTGSF